MDGWMPSLLPYEQDATQGIFKAEFNRLEFRIFLPLDQLPHQD